MDYTFQFADATVMQGRTVDVPLYLVESGTDNLNTIGLRSAGVQLTIGTPSITTVSATTPNPAFDKTKVTTGTTPSVRESIKKVPPVTAPGDSRILIGDFTFRGLTIGSAPIAMSIPGGKADNVLANGTIIDSLITHQAATLTVTAVPEPSAFLLTGLASILLLLFGRRKRA
jgi:hypothetical protein